MWAALVPFLFAVVLLQLKCQEAKAKALPASTVKVVREIVGIDGSLYDVDGSPINSDLFTTPDWCQMETENVIVFSHPVSMHPSDRFFVLGYLSYEAQAMTVDFINSERCGVNINGKNYSVRMQTMGDRSDSAQHGAIGRYYSNRTDFFLSGYSSSLTQELIAVAEEAKKPMIAGGSSLTSIYVDRDYAFTLLPQGRLYADQAIQGLIEQGARTLAVIEETGASCITSLSLLAEKYSMDLVETTIVDPDPSMDELLPLARNMSEINPDVVYACYFQESCAQWIAAMRETGWNPKAQIFSLCVGSTELETAAGLDLGYMMGVSSWDKVFPDIPDEVTGWTPSEFADLFEATTFRNASYQQTAAAAVVSVYVQAIERAQSLDTDVILGELLNGTFTTMFGEVSFDENGQNEALSVALQYDPAAVLRVAYPPSKATTEEGILYPMPTWSFRDCVTLSLCTTTNGTCLDDGTCDCTAAAELSTLKVVGIGEGTQAFCKEVPNEDFNYISDSVLAIGYTCVAIQGVLSLSFMIWTFYYRNMVIVKAAQPFFLILVAFGCFVLSCSIIPSALQGEYRYLRDEQTGVPLPGVPNDEIGQLDAGCMAAPWLAGIGFAVVFSALFAKIWRVKKLMANAENFVRSKVEVKDVLNIVVVIVAVEVGLFLTWQLVDPLTWQREVLLEDDNGFVLRSVGSCSSENSLPFLISICLFNGGCLIYAIWLCYITRHIPDDFAETKWITISIVSILQILLLAIPTLIIAEEDRSAAFFVRSMVVFLMSSSVSIFVFVPKLVRMRETQHQPQDARILQIRTSKFGNQPSGTSGNLDLDESFNGSSRFIAAEKRDSDVIISEALRLDLEQKPSSSSSASSQEKSRSKKPTISKSSPSESTSPWAALDFSATVTDGRPSQDETVGFALNSQMESIIEETDYETESKEMNTNI